MHDGQNLFDNATSYSGEWGIDEFLDSINKKNKQEVIVVGIDNGGEFRMSEYNPYPFRNFKAEGKQYVDFLVNTLKPFIDKNYRTLSEKKYTYIAGSSMGGLISLYAIMQYPSVFQAAGIFSPAFWTAPAMDSLVAKDALKVHAKLFFYAGGKESKAMVSDMKRIERIIQKRSSSKVFEKIDPGAHHNEQAWRKYFPLFYQWAIE
jgi:predicted alpha/beta superfamily hydrolase